MATTFAALENCITLTISIMKDNLAGNSDYSEVIEKLRKAILTHHEPSGVTYEVPKRKRT